MNVRAIYEDGVFKPQESVQLEERTEVEIDVRELAPPKKTSYDPKSFVGFLKGAPRGVSVAREHDAYLDK